MGQTEEAEADIINRLRDIMDLYKVDQPAEGFKRLTMLFIDLTAASTCCFPEENQTDFLTSLTTVILIGISNAVKVIERQKEKKSPTKPQMVIKMNAEFKS